MTEEKKIEIKCEICGKALNSEQGLSNHKRDKHGITIKKEKSKNKFSNKLIFYFIAVFVIFFVVMAFNYLTKNVENSCQKKDVLDLYITSHTQIPLHIHPHLQIIINGQQELIPAGIGIENEIMRAIHIHDSSGTLHVEPPCIRDLTLGDFFKIWGKEFNSNCIFDNCVADSEINEINDSNENSNGKSLKFFVDGKENSEFENLILRDNQRIVIEFKS